MVLSTFCLFSKIGTEYTVSTSCIDITLSLGTEQKSAIFFFSSFGNSCSDLGGTMRLGGQLCKLKKGSNSLRMYKNSEIIERHRHRYEVNPKYKEDMIKKGLDVVGTSIDGKLVEMIEIPKHKWFLACQFHPEFTSNPRDGHPIFNSYIKSTLRK